MPTTIPTQRVDFRSGGTRCAAWLTQPPGAGRIRRSFSYTASVRRTT